MLVRITVLIAILTASETTAQAPIALDDPASPAVQVLELGDPFFELVVKAKPQPIVLADVEDAIQPVAAQRRRFAVAETLQSANPGPRRAVISFQGQTTSPSGGRVDVDATVMLSVFFVPGRLPNAENGTEVWGWDAARGRFNYYKLAGSTWTFTGTSSGPEVANKTGCMQCHHNGTPIMKELLEPWSNWHSSEDEVLYLFDAPWNPPGCPHLSQGRPRPGRRA